MELTLKDQSVIEIGQELGDRVGEVVQTGTSLVPAGAGATNVAADVQPMSPVDSMMAIFQDIRDGIYQLVDKFSDGVSLQQEQLEQEEMAAQSAALGETEANLESGDGDDSGPSFLEKGKEKVNELMNAGGLKGLLVKGGLIFGLLGIAKVLQKYGKQIGEALTPVVDGIKTFFSFVKDDLGTFFDDSIQYVKDAFSGIFKVIKGIFSGDGQLITEGLTTLLELPAKFVSMIGKLAVGILEAVMKAFGVDPIPEWVQSLYSFFEDFPKNIKQLFTDIGNFFTETIPNKFNEITNAITSFFDEWIVQPIKNLWTDIGTFFTETIPTKYNEVVNKITTFFSDIVTGIQGFFTDAKTFVTDTIPTKIGEVTDGIVTKFNEIKDSIIDFAMAPFRKIKSLMQDLLVGILESVEGLPFIGDKAKALKASILGESDATNEMASTGADASMAMNVQGNQIGNIPTAEDGTVLDPKSGDTLKIKDEDQAKLMAGELTATGKGIFEPVYDDGGFFGRAFYRIKKVDAASGQNFALNPPGATVTGANLNTQGADFVASEMGGQGAFVNTGGNNVSQNSSIVQQNYGGSEGTSTNDTQNLQAALG